MLNSPLKKGQEIFVGRRQGRLFSLDGDATRASRGAGGPSDPRERRRNQKPRRFDQLFWCKRGAVL